MIAGGNFEASADLYHPGTRKFIPTGTMFSERASFTLVRLTDGSVLAAGGYDIFDSAYLSGTEIYHPDFGTWSLTSFMHHARADYAAALLGDKTVLVAGGSKFGVGLSSAEIYHPTSKKWKKAASMNFPRAMLRPSSFQVARSWWRGGSMPPASPRPRPSCTTRLPGRGHSLGACTAPGPSTAP